MHLHLPRTQIISSIHVRFGITVFLNAILTVAQVIYAHKAHSVSLLSDALHNLGDVLSLLIAWGAQILARSKRHPTRYTYGYQKTTILASFFNALLLLFSVGFIVRETFFKLSHESVMDEMQVLFIAVLGILVNGFTALLFIKEKDTNFNIRAAFLHLILDALTSLGVVISTLIVYYGGYQWIDSMTACLIAAVIWISGWRLFRSSLDLLLGAIPPHINLTVVTEYLKNIPGVIDTQNIHIWALGTEKAALTAELFMQDTSTPINYSAIKKELAQKFRIEQVTLQTIPTKIQS